MGNIDDQKRLQQLLHKRNTSTKIAFSSLKPIQQAAITLFEQQHSLHDISEILGVPEYTLNHMYKQALHSVIQQIHRVPVQRFYS